MENYLSPITNYLLTQSWQIAILVVVIAAVNLALKNKSTHIRYLLWLIVLAKCLVPPLFIVPLAVLPQERYAESDTVSPVQAPNEFFLSLGRELKVHTADSSGFYGKRIIYLLNSIILQNIF